MTTANTQPPSTTSIAQLITEFHKTTGDIPPLLIGATTTLVDDSIYLFGGRLQLTRQISNRLYILNLNSKVWKSVVPENKAPTPRYFHSANHDGYHHLLFYGGMGVQGNSKEMTALNDLFFLNIQTMSWEYAQETEDQPSNRYAHISTFVNDKLIIMGGQDVNNEYLNDIRLYNFKLKEWCTPPLSSEQYQYGAYRSAAFAVTPIQITPQFAPTMDLLSTKYDESSKTSVEEDNIIIHAYTNFSTTDVTRQLHSWKINNKNEVIEMQDQSDSIAMGNSLPPPLRFPTAFMCGQQFILAGPHVSTANQQFQIWALDMTSFVWTKIEAGNVLSEGSWLRGLLNEKSNRFLVFGHPHRSMLDDYKDRVQSFEHLACVNMEIFGIYRPPNATYSTFGQQLGLSLLKDPALSDLKLITTDGKHAFVNSAILAQRWPSIRQILRPILSPQSTNNTTELDLLDFEKRELSFPDSNVVLIAFLQFIYTDNLVTAQQHQPHILARLLFIADLFDIPRLKELSTHALHQMLNIQTASMIYESAILSNAVALQIRALRVLLNAKKLIQRQKQMETMGEKPPFLPPQQQQQQQQQSPSRFLEKYEQQPGFSSSVRNVNTSSSSSPNLFSSFNPQHTRTPSQRSLSTDSAPTTPATPSKSMKLSNFRVRQTSSAGSDVDYSPLSSNTSSPKLTPISSSTHIKPATISGNTGRSHSSFWKNSSQKTLPSVIENKSSKSEGTARSGAFSFLSNNHN